MNPAIIQLAIAILTIMGAGLSVYVGVRVAIAEVRRDIENAGNRIDGHERRLDRLENPFFDQPPPHRR